MLGFNALATQPLADDGVGSSVAYANASASLTQANNAISSTGRVRVAANATNTEVSDSIASTATVAVRGNSTLAQASQTGTSGGQALVDADLAPGLQVDNSLTSSGRVALRGTASNTEAADTTASSVRVAVRGTATFTQPANTISASADAIVSGNYAQTQASNTFTSTGTNRVSANANITTQNALASTGTIAIRGSLSQAQEAQTSTSEVDNFVQGNQTTAQASNTLAATGKLPVAGSVSQAELNDTTTSSVRVEIKGSVTATQENQLGSNGRVFVRGNATFTQASNTFSATAKGRVSARLNITQENNGFSMKEPVQVFLPSWTQWAKTKDKNKPKAPKLPDPVQRGELVIDEAVLQQMEIERINALVMKGKQEAAERVEKMREEYWVAKPDRKLNTIKAKVIEVPPEPEPPARPSFVLAAAAPKAEAPQASTRQSASLNRFAPREEIAAPTKRRQIVSMFREQPKPKPIDPVRGSITPRVLGARLMPEPQMSKTKTIVLRRQHPMSSNRNHTAAAG
jgi:hypothetical protein